MAMKSLIVLSCVVSAVLAASFSTSRILGGKNAKPGQFKYQVSLKRNGEFFCGGSILSRTKILTAAHCVFGSKIPITVVVGEVKLSSPGTAHKVKTIAMHEGYNQSTLANDVAVLTLNSTIIYNENVQPIALATADPPGGSTVTFSGWGITTYPGNFADNLQYIELKVVAREDCYKAVNQQHVCTIAPRDRGACRGDSGSPLVNAAGLQVGIVSWGAPCGLGMPNVYTSVAYFRQWILSKL